MPPALFEPTIPASQRLQTQSLSPLGPWYPTELQSSYKNLYSEQDRQCTYKSNTEARSCNRCCCVKAILHMMRERVALVIQYAECIRRIILSSVARVPLQYFSTLSHKRHYFRKKAVEYKMYVLIFPVTFVWNISFYEEFGEVLSKLHVHLHVKHPLYCQILMKLRSSRVSINTQILWKPVQWEPSCSMRTDMTKLIATFRNFAPKNLSG